MALLSLKIIHTWKLNYGRWQSLRTASWQHITTVTWRWGVIWVQDILYIQRISHQLLLFVIYNIHASKFSSDFSSFLLVIWITLQIKCFTLWMDVHHLKITAHLTRLFLGMLSCTSSYITTFQLALVTPSHTSSRPAFFGNSPLC